MTPYWSGDGITLYLGDCREVTEWLDADVLVTDPPYGRDDRGGGPGRTHGHVHRIANDKDTAVRDAAVMLWGARPAVVFADLRSPVPGSGQVLVMRKGRDAGWRSTAGFRRDAEAICLLSLPAGYGGRSSILATGCNGQTHMTVRYGHPHAKPVDMMEILIAACPPGVIADPFAGSGSTLIAARNLGRHAIGVEIDERYAEMAARRLSQGVLLTGAVS